MIHLDTSFLVDLLRETRRADPGPATALLDRLAGDELGISVHVACELYAGVERSASRRKERARVDELCDTLHVVYPDDRFAPLYGRLLADLRRAGEPIATMDLLIGTAAIVEEAPLVSRNPRHFGRLPGLDLIEY